ncbi:hypothetical protein CARUB_v10022323mg, partial [Capsella rubella]
MSQETQESSSVPPMNKHEEVLRQYESYWDNPSYYDSDNILLNITHMPSPSNGFFEGSLDYAGDMGSELDPNLTQMKPTSRDVKNNSDQSYSDQSYLSVEGSDVRGEGYSINTSGPFEYRSNIDFGCFGSIESMMNAQREREKVVMIPTPRTVNEYKPQWTITKELTGNNVSPNSSMLVLQEIS